MHKQGSDLVRPKVAYCDKTFSRAARGARMMRLYLDTEFTQLNRFTYRLISLALVSSDGQEFYVELEDNWTEDECSDFTQSIVLPQLDLPQHGRSTEQARLDLLSFLHLIGSAEIISDAMAWDWPLLLWLAGPSGLPEGIEAGTFPAAIQSDAEELDDAPHHALLDARQLAETIERHIRCSSPRDRKELMTVAQLIQLLQQFPDDMAVLVEGNENDYDPIHSLSIQELVGVQNAADYDGLFDTPNNLVMEIPGEKLTGIRAIARKENGERLSCVVIAGLRGQRR